jgi:hypothetical protein
MDALCAKGRAPTPFRICQMSDLITRGSQAALPRWQRMMSCIEDVIGGSRGPTTAPHTGAYSEVVLGIIVHQVDFALVRTHEHAFQLDQVLVVELLQNLHAHST